MPSPQPPSAATECHEDDGYHLAAAVALHAYAALVVATPIGTPHSVWGATYPDARAVGECDAVVWAAVTDALNDADKAALDAAIAATVTDTAIRARGVVGVRGEVELILRDHACRHELARDACRHELARDACRDDHSLEIGSPCPSSAS